MGRRAKVEIECGGRLRGSEVAAEGICRCGELWQRVDGEARVDYIENMNMNLGKSTNLVAKRKRKARRRRMKIRGLRPVISFKTEIKSELQISTHTHPESSADQSSDDSSRREESIEEGYSLEGLVYGHVSMIGRRRVMEDAVTVAPPGWLAGEYYFFAAYDGHGGAKVVETCGERLHKYLGKHKEKAKKVPEENLDWEKVMAECFSSMDEEFGENMSRDESEQTEAERIMGSTAVVVLVGKEEVVVANCGDSRAVLCRGGVAMPLSSDRKLDRADEKERIEAAGGRIINWRVESELAISRSLGNQCLKPYVTSEPEVTIVRRSERDEFLMIATNGLFDVVSNEVACEVVKKCLSGQLERYASEETNASEAAATLAELAIAKGSRANISVIIVQLK
ncbi:hypothetical protein BUALT_Bualt10G0065000 [Buddleja alternifolia]|uniref:PPM-type phosphatase domain-containing protein n=1 Tax=Buddleja alternifolia TaxID=168488 RepID=A0AAV6X7G5_9LAMI|nr:hypothetical protein BUALT_Bualt10G0065000 [Buddleja alternifolia]